MTDESTTRRGTGNDLRNKFRWPGPIGALCHNRIGLRERPDGAAVRLRLRLPGHGDASARRLIRAAVLSRYVLHSVSQVGGVASLEPSDRLQLGRVAAQVVEEPSAHAKQNGHDVKLQFV